MRDRFRTFDSKISFFAFADIITAVSGVLIFITLLLATDLGRPTDAPSASADSDDARQLQQILLEQSMADARNQRLAELLTAAESAPVSEKIEADIARLRAQLAVEQAKSSATAGQLFANRAAVDARDRALGLTDLKAQIENAARQNNDLAKTNAALQQKGKELEQRVAALESTRLKLHAREGKLWLIPDTTSTSKEPVLVTVGGSEIGVQRFDLPALARVFQTATVLSQFEAYLGTVKPVNQYLVFLIRPSGIPMFDELVKMAREKGFEVGYDAVEEGLEIQFTAAPPVEETVPAVSSTRSPATTEVTSNSLSGSNPNPPITSPSGPATQPAVPKAKSWWRRFLEAVGLS